MVSHDSLNSLNLVIVLGIFKISQFIAENREFHGFIHSETVFALVVVRLRLQLSRLRSVLLGRG